MATTLAGGAYLRPDQETLVDCNNVPLSKETEAGLQQLNRQQEQTAQQVAKLQQPDPQRETDLKIAQLQAESAQKDLELVNKVRDEQSAALAKQEAEMAEMREKLAAFEARSATTGRRS